MLIDTPAAVLKRCALQRNSPAADVQRTLEELERTQSTEPAAVADFDGRWELVWSSAATKLPLLNGHLFTQPVAFGVLAGEPYTEIWRRAQRTTAVLWTAAAVLLGAVARRLLIV